MLPWISRGLSFLLVFAGPTSVHAPEFVPIPIIDAHLCRAVPIERLLVAAQNAAARQDLPVALFLHRIWQESHFQPDAIHEERNGSRSFGLSGLNDRWYPGAEKMSWEENLKVGAKYLAENLKRCGGRREDWDCAEWAYRSGRVEKGLRGVTNTTPH